MWDSACLIRKPNLSSRRLLRWEYWYLSLATLTGIFSIFDAFIGIDQTNEGCYQVSLGTKAWRMFYRQRAMDLEVKPFQLTTHTNQSYIHSSINKTTFHKIFKIPFITWSIHYLVYSLPLLVCAFIYQVLRDPTWRGWTYTIGTAAKKPSTFYHERMCWQYSLIFVEKQVTIIFPFSEPSVE